MTTDSRANRPKLGRGLAALLGDESTEPANATEDGGSSKYARSLPVAALAPGASQPRQTFDDTALDALAQSIRERGMLQPIIARRLADEPGRYEIVAGERRWRAAQRAGLADVPVILREMSDRDALEIALVENIQREDLNPIEEARGFQNLVDAFAYTQEDLARAVGRSRPHVANMLRLLSLPPEVSEMLVSGDISSGHARALLVAADPLRLAKIVVARGLNVRQTEKLVQEGGLPSTRAPATPDPNVQAVERTLADALGLKVALRPKGKKGGSLVVEYGDLDQLDLLIGRLTRPSLAASHDAEAEGGEAFEPADQPSDIYPETAEKSDP